MIGAARPQKTAAFIMILGWCWTALRVNIFQKSVPQYGIGIATCPFFYHLKNNIHAFAPSCLYRCCRNNPSLAAPFALLFTFAARILSADSRAFVTTYDSVTLITVSAHMRQSTAYVRGLKTRAPSTRTPTKTPTTVRSVQPVFGSNVCAAARRYSCPPVPAPKEQAPSTRRSI